MRAVGIVEPLQVSVSSIKNAASAAFPLFYSAALLIKQD
jgi:chaperonin GroEL (HSP60 family)